MGLALNALAGLLFGLGLIVSGMINPAKVLSFLDLFGAFDRSLAFVMLGAMVVTFAGYRLALGQPRPILSERFQADRRPRGHRAGHLRGWLGPLRILPRTGHHLAAPARQGDARLRADHACRDGGEAPRHVEGVGRSAHDQGQQAQLRRLAG